MSSSDYFFQSISDPNHQWFIDIYIASSDIRVHIIVVQVEIKGQVSKCLATSCHFIIIIISYYFLLLLFYLSPSAFFMEGGQKVKGCISNLWHASDATRQRSHLYSTPSGPFCPTHICLFSCKHKHDNKAHDDMWVVKIIYSLPLSFQDLGGGAQKL